MNQKASEASVGFPDQEWVLPTLPPSDLPYDDGVPLESNWHRLAMNLLIEALGYYWRERTDFFVGGNMFVYFNVDQVRTRDFRGPDFFVVRGVERRKPRLYWATWDEDGAAPNVIVELTSPTTAVQDRTTKKDIYEQRLRTPEYYLYDPTTERFEGWRLNDEGVYQPIAAGEHGWLWSKQLNLWLGNWRGSYLEVPGLYPRFYEKGGELVLIGDEAQAQRADAEQQRADAEQQQKEMERQRADAEQQRADAERQRADAEQQRADAEQQRADAEKQQKERERQRADALAAELARLRARLGKRQRNHRRSLEH